MIEDAIEGLKKELESYGEWNEGAVAKMVADTGLSL